MRCKKYCDIMFHRFFIEMSSKEYCDKCEFEITELDERHLIDSSGKCNPNMYDSPIILCQNCPRTDFSSSLNILAPSERSRCPPGTRDTFLHYF